MYQLFLAPTSAPHNVSVQRLSSGTAMNVSFIRLSIVEAQSVSVTYTVRYSLTAFRKRQSNVKDVIVPEEEHHVVIRGLDRATPYHVIVEASNSHGTMSSSSVTTHPGKNCSTVTISREGSSLPQTLTPSTTESG